MAKNPLIYIIILNYNSWSDCLETVDSLQDVSYSDFKTLVLDNNSTDESEEKLKEKLPENVDFLQVGENLGFAGGNNVGIKKALKEGVDYVLLLNPDVKVRSDFLKKLVEVYESPEKYEGVSNIGFLQPFILYYEPDDLVYSNGGYVNWDKTFATPKDNAKKVGEIERKKQPFESDYVTGTALFASREVIEDIGLMAEDYFLYCEDTDWSLQAAGEGYNHYVVPDSVIWHKEAVSTGLHSYIHIYYNSRNGMLLGFRRGGPLVKLFVLLKSVWIFIKQVVKLVFIPQKRDWAKAIMRAMIDFWRGKTGKIKG